MFVLTGCGNQRKDPLVDEGEVALDDSLTFEVEVTVVLIVMTKGRHW